MENNAIRGLVGPRRLFVIPGSSLYPGLLHRDLKVIVKMCYKIFLANLIRYKISPCTKSLSDKFLHSLQLLYLKRGI